MVQPETACVGLIGTQSSHASDLVRLLNSAHGSAAPVMMRAWDRDRAPLPGAEKYGVEQVGAFEDLLGQSDVVLVLDRDGASHAETARAVIDRRLPLFVDKPLARSAEEAQNLVAHARSARVPMVSASALRWAPEMAALRDTVRSMRRTGPCSIRVSGPADPACPWGGLWFYGTHVAEVACDLIELSEPAELRLRGVEELTGEQAGVAVHADVGHVRLQVDLLHGPPGSAPFEVEVQSGLHQRPLRTLLTVGTDYLAPIADQVRRLTTPGPALHPMAAALPPIRLLEAAVSSSPG